jgi:hypothetical protein
MIIVDDIEIDMDYLDSEDRTSTPSSTLAANLQG